MEVLNINYVPDPIYHSRMIKPEDANIKLESGKTLEEDKIEFPSIFDNSFSVEVTTEKEKFSFTVPVRYSWNNADIVGLLQVIAACSRDDRRVILASGVHDYMLLARKELLEEFKKFKFDLTVDDYILLTSETFGFIAHSQGMDETKAKIMAKSIYLYQKLGRSSEWMI